ncbi:MAG: hypothetical protein ACO4CG_00200, partial [Prochlorothrix sp.]
RAKLKRAKLNQNRTKTGWQLPSCKEPVRGENRGNHRRRSTPISAPPSWPHRSARRDRATV